MFLAKRETTRVRGWQLVALATLLVAIALGSASAREWAEDPRTKKECALKAAFLYNFVKFVTWPTGDGEQDEPFVIAILGEDPFGPFIDQALGGKKIKGREVRIRRVAGTDGLFSAYDRGEENCTVDGQREGHTPIVAVTANALVGDRETCLQREPTPTCPSRSKPTSSSALSQCWAWMLPWRTMPQRDVLRRTE